MLRSEAGCGSVANSGQTRNETFDGVVVEAQGHRIEKTDGEDGNKKNAKCINHEDVYYFEGVHLLRCQQGGQSRTWSQTSPPDRVALTRGCTIGTFQVAPRA